MAGKRGELASGINGNSGKVLDRISTKETISAEQGAGVGGREFEPRSCELCQGSVLWHQGPEPDLFSRCFSCCLGEVPGKQHLCPSGHSSQHEQRPAVSLFPGPSVSGPHTSATCPLHPEARGLPGDVLSSQAAPGRQ